MQAKENSLDVVGSSPLVLEDIEADSAREIDIWVVDWCLEKNGWWGIWVVGWELEGELESEVGIWSIIWTVDGSSPSE